MVLSVSDLSDKKEVIEIVDLIKQEYDKNGKMTLTLKTKDSDGTIKEITVFWHRYLCYGTMITICSNILLLLVAIQEEHLL